MRVAGAARRRVSSTVNSLTEMSIGAAVAGDGAAERVELYPGRAQDAGLGGGLAAGQGADAQYEFGEVEGFGQVVVGPQGESGDLVAGGAGGGEHEDHDRVAGRGDRAADGVAVDAGQVAVQDEHVVGVQVQLGGGVGAVVGDVGGDALVTQALGDVVGQPPDILGDQDPHRAPPATAS